MSNFRYSKSQPQHQPQQRPIHDPNISVGKTPNLNNTLFSNFANTPLPPNSAMNGGGKKKTTSQYDTISEMSELSDLDNDEDDSNAGSEQLPVFNNTDPEFLKMKEIANNWMNLDKDIKTLQKAIRDRKKKMNELNPSIMEFMHQYNLQILGTNGGENKIKYTTTHTKISINRPYIVQKLTDYFRNPRKAEEIAVLLYDNRESRERQTLKSDINLAKK